MLNAVHMAVISVKDLTKTYIVGEVEVRALRGVSLDVQTGEFVAVTGPSGSGKSTFMHILGCLDRPTTGQYVLDGKNVSSMSRDELARDPQPQDRVRLPGFQPALAHDGARQRRAAAPLQRRRVAQDRANGIDARWRPLRRSASTTARTTTRISSRADNSSAWPSRERSSTSRRSSLRTSRRATSTRGRASRSWTFFSG